MPPAVYEGHGLVSVETKWQCTTTSEDGSSYSSPGTGSFEIPIKVGIVGTEFTAEILRCDNEKMLEAELRVANPGAVPLGIASACRSFYEYWGSNSQSRVFGVMHGELTRIYIDPNSPH